MNENVSFCILIERVQYNAVVAIGCAIKNQLKICKFDKF